MTKVSVFGEKPTEEKKELKKIEFVKNIQGLDITEDGSQFSVYENVMLLELDYFSCGYDLIWKYNLPDDGLLCFGHWNDGVV
jgi:hypothetical protein